MVKAIKVGSKGFHCTTCGSCDSELLFHERDVNVHDWGIILGVSREIKCPICGNTITLNANYNNVAVK